MIVSVILTSSALVLQVWFLFRNLPDFFLRRKKRRLYSKIQKFQIENFEELSKTFTDSGLFMKYFNMHDELARMHYKDSVTYEELKEGFLNLKIAYSEYLPRIKKELRDKNIDNILNN